MKGPIKPLPQPPTDQKLVARLTDDGVVIYYWQPQTIELSELSDPTSFEPKPSKQQIIDVLYPSEPTQPAGEVCSTCGRPLKRFYQRDYMRKKRAAVGKALSKASKQTGAFETKGKKE